MAKQKKTRSKKVKDLDPKSRAKNVKGGRPQRVAFRPERVSLSGG